MKAFNPKLFSHNTSMTQPTSTKSYPKTSITPTGSTSTKITFPITNNTESSEYTIASNKPSSSLQSRPISEHSSKQPRKALVIDVNLETQTYNIVGNSRISPYTTTNAYGVGSSRPVKSPANVSLNAPMSTKSSKGEPQLNYPGFISPKKSLVPAKFSFPGNFPHTTTNASSNNRIGSASATGSLDAFLNQLSPKSLHLRSVSTKSYTSEAQKPPLSRLESNTSHLVSNEKQANLKEASQMSSDTNESSSLTKHSTSNENKENGIDYESGNGLESNKPITGPAQMLSKKNLAPIPNHEPTKCSIKRHGIVKAYAANTNQGIVRNYNEDRVSIILNIMKPTSRQNEEWPKCSFFGVYDGHGGVACADFLRDNLHQYVIKEPSFPSDPREAIMRGFEAAEQAFIAYADSRPNGEIDKSGSCAIVALIVGDMCYIANVGDSRAVMSGDGGAKIYHLSRDHKPNEDNEQKRIIDNGGKIYQTQAPVFRPASDGAGGKGQMQVIVGPHRVFPGRLSVSRTFGDIEAKLPKYGGNPNCVIALPEIKAFKINDSHDFIVLACDGIFDKLSSKDCVKVAWESANERASDIHHQCGLGVEEIMRESLYRRTFDNITVVMIGLKNFKHKLFPRNKQSSIASEGVSKQIFESTSTPLGSLANRSLLNGGGYKHDGKALRERVNGDENTYNSHSNYNYLDTKKTSYNLSKENSSNVSGAQFEKRPLDRESSSLNKDSVHASKRPASIGRKELAGNEENQNSGSYYDYLQHGHIVKPKSMDYKSGDFMRFNMKGANK